MRDIAHEETEALIAKAEREIERTYARAAKESRKKLNEYMRQFRKDDKKYAALVKAGKLSQEDYIKWRKEAMLRGKQWKDMLDTLADDYTQADLIAMNIVNGHTPEAYALNANHAAYEIERGTMYDTSFTLYDRQTVERLLREKPDLLPKPQVDIPRDRRWNRRKIREEITQAILRGESMDDAADRLMRVIGMDYSAAIRNARTAITGAENAGRVDSYRRAQEMGIDLKQKWMATLDSLTRHSHVVMDGEQINVGGTFSNGCKYPGDPSGPPEEIYNCRCTLVAELTGFSFTDAPRNSKLGRMSYEQWKEAHK